MVFNVQVQGNRAILRYWLLVQFVYLFFYDLYGIVFTQTIYCVRKHEFTRIIEFMHTTPANGTSLEQITKELQVASDICHWFLDGNNMFSIRLI